MKIHIFQIKVNDGRRKADPEAVQELANSIAELGLLNPITVDQDYTLIAGLHRLEAAKRLGWAEIECNISGLEGLMSELAEIDENVVRKGLSAVEYSDLLLRRKEIYEMLHPETKATYDGGAFRGNQHQRVVAAKNAATTKSFVQDTADKIGKSPRTIRQAIKTAKNMTPAAKNIIQGTDTKITKADALKLSRLPPEQQEEAARQLVDEYQSAPKELEAAEEQAPVSSDTDPSTPSESPEPSTAPPASGTGYYPTIQDSIDDLKNPDKDRRCTPDSFLTTFSYFLQRFCQSMDNYTGPEYDAVLPVLTQEHLDQIRQKIQSVHTALDGLLNKIERKTQNGTA